VVEHLVGWESFQEKQVDASSGTVFFVEAARTSRTSRSGTQNSMGFCSCSLQDGLVELKSLLSVGPFFIFGQVLRRIFFEDKAGSLNAMIGWISSPVNTRFSSTPPFHSTRNNRHTTHPLRRISGYCRPGRFTEAFWESKMGTQYTTDIPFSSSHRQQAFKLLELPPELLAHLESDNPPMCAHPLLLPSTRLKCSAD
jgi:hypothetical protein